MFLGIEIGGTKLQLGVGDADGGELFGRERLDVDPAAGAQGILKQIEHVATRLVAEHHPVAIGVGFGGPVNSRQGKVMKSHQIGGWNDIELAKWLQERFHRPAYIANDCDVAALAEARYGAGRGKESVFFVTVGTGVGGGFVSQGRLTGQGRPASAEIGHLRPGMHADRPEVTVESMASGWGIVAEAQARLTGQVSRPLETVRSGDGPVGPDQIRQRLADADQADEEFAADLVERSGGEIDKLTAKMVAQAAADGNEVAREVLEHACQVLGWAMAQVVTLIAPDVIVIGGGVSLIGRTFFLTPVEKEIERYVFPPLLGSYEVVPAALGEWVVVQGSLALAADRHLGE